MKNKIIDYLKSFNDKILTKKLLLLVTICLIIVNGFLFLFIIVSFYNFERENTEKDIINVQNCLETDFTSTSTSSTSSEVINNTLEYQKKEIFDIPKYYGVDVVAIEELSEYENIRFKAKPIKDIKIVNADFELSTEGFVGYNFEMKDKSTVEPKGPNYNISFKYKEGLLIKDGEHTGGGYGRVIVSNVDFEMQIGTPIESFTGGFYENETIYEFYTNSNWGTVLKTSTIDEQGNYITNYSNFYSAQLACISSGPTNGFYWEPPCGSRLLVNKNIEIIYGNAYSITCVSKTNGRECDEILKTLNIEVINSE